MHFGLWPVMQQQPNVQVRCFEVVRELASVGWAQEDRRLDFDDDSFLDEEVNPMPADSVLLVDDAYRHFSSDAEATIS